MDDRFVQLAVFSGASEVSHSTSGFHAVPQPSSGIQQLLAAASVPGGLPNSFLAPLGQNCARPGQLNGILNQLLAAQRLPGNAAAGSHPGTIGTITTAGAPAGQSVLQLPPGMQLAMPAAAGRPAASTNYVQGASNYATRHQQVGHGDCLLLLVPLPQALALSCRMR